MMARPTIFAGVLYSGESTFERVIAALEAQVGIDLKLVVIGGFDEAEAHRRLYKIFNDSAADCNYFAKVDADMVLLNSRVLSAAASTLGQDPTLDQISIPVADWLSGENLSGLHIWTSRVRWKLEVPRLFTDQVQSSVRRRLRLPPSEPPLVSHAPDPTAAQAARFAARRALKAGSAASPRESLAYFLILARMLQLGISDKSLARRVAAAAVEFALDEPARAEQFVLTRGSEPSVLDELILVAKSDEAVCERLLRRVENLTIPMKPSGGHKDVRPGAPASKNFARVFGAVNAKRRFTEKHNRQLLDSNLRTHFLRDLNLG